VNPIFSSKSLQIFFQKCLICQQLFWQNVFSDEFGYIFGEMIPSWKLCTLNPSRFPYLSSSWSQNFSSKMLTLLGPHQRLFKTKQIEYCRSVTKIPWTNHPQTKCTWAKLIQGLIVKPPKPSVLYIILCVLRIVFSELRSKSDKIKSKRNIYVQ
jgi:hypothetical protein